MSWHSPLADIENWELSSEAVTIPAGFRFSEYETRALRASRSSISGSGEVQAPAAGCVAVRSIAASGGTPGMEVVELTPLAFRFRAVAQAAEAGLPIFYFLLPEGTGGIHAIDDQVVAFGETIANVNEVRILAVFPDRLPREPALWSAMLLQAIEGNGDDSHWRPFADAVAAGTSGAPNSPVLLLDHAGRPLDACTIQVNVNGVNRDISMASEDHGDLQAAIARLHRANPSDMPIPDLWGEGAVDAVLRPAGGDVQLALLEDGSSSASTITITPAQRHIMLTDLHNWFAEQFAVPSGAAVSPLARYSRGNKLTPLINGIETFNDIFAQLNEARRSANGAFHLASWSIFAEEELVKKPADAPEDYPLTLAEAATLIGSAGGKCRFLATDFVQVSDPEMLEAIETLALLIILAGEMIRRILPAALRDGTGLLLTAAILVASPFIMDYLESDDFKVQELYQPAFDTLGLIENSYAKHAKLPFTVDDNPLADIDHILFGASEPLFDAIRHFSVYHQKLAIVRRDTDFVGYCGGIDFNPDRLDDHRHLISDPYHDVHACIEGPAVRDLAITFDERWQRDGEGEAPAFSVRDTADIASAGSHVMQVARTYGTSADPARQLSFSPGGDRTLLNTLIAAIGQAREYIYIEDQYLTPPQEYVDALLESIESGKLRKLIIVLPNMADQPFGEIRRTEVIRQLRSAAADAGKPDMVRIGSPRRRFTIPKANLRSSSGRLILKEDITSSLTGTMAIALGPPDRIPKVPFWVAVNGELIWVYDESTLPNPDPENMKIYKVARGDATRIVSGFPPGKGTKVREHKQGSAATLVNMNGIYVHAKLMIIDDVFVGIGSANLNRRGFYSDGECNVFVVPENLRSGVDNPVRILRKQLWAEMLDLPLSIADPLLEDPVAASELFDRSYFVGNRFVRFEAFPTHAMIRNWTGGDGLVFAILNQFGFAMLFPESQIPLFDTVVDPSSALDPDAP